MSIKVAEHAHLQTLLELGDVSAACMQVLATARGIRSREQALCLRAAINEVPHSWRTQAQWPLALAWVAYRSFDVALLKEALSYVSEGNLLTFRGVLADAVDDYAESAQLCRMALETGLHPQDEAVALRHLAIAANRLLWPDWETLFQQALLVAQGRDRGLVRSAYANALGHRELDHRARSEYLQATVELNGDPYWLSEAWANLGIMCMRMDAFVDAEQALKKALTYVQSNHTNNLIMIRRALGTTYRALGEYPRSLHALELSASIADSPEMRVESLSSAVRTLALMGRRDEALEKAYEAAAHMRVLEQGHHPILLHVALAKLLIHDLHGAREVLERSQVRNTSEEFFFKLLWADLLRQEGNQAAAQAMINQVDEQQFKRWRHPGLLFPEVYAMRGVVIPPPPEWQVRVSLDGPVRAWMHGEELDLRSTRPAAGLLALLVFSGGQVSRERALDVLDLPGKTPQARRKALSAGVADLREVLGWPDSVMVQGGVLRLSGEPRWLPPELPGPGREDFFCEGRFDPWVIEWRTEQLLLK